MALLARSAASGPLCNCASATGGSVHAVHNAPVRAPQAAALSTSDDNTGNVTGHLKPAAPRYSPHERSIAARRPCPLPTGVPGLFKDNPQAAVAFGRLRSVIVRKSLCSISAAIS
jgi:hypothetical protein